MEKECIINSQTKAPGMQIAATSYSFLAIEMESQNREEEGTVDEKTYREAKNHRNTKSKSTLKQDVAYTMKTEGGTKKEKNQASTPLQLKGELVPVFDQPEQALLSASERSGRGEVLQEQWGQHNCHIYSNPWYPHKVTKIQKSNVFLKKMHPE